MFQIWSLFVLIVTLVSVLVVVLETIPALRVVDNTFLPDANFNDSSSHIFSHLSSTRPHMVLVSLEFATFVLLAIDLILKFIFSPFKREFFTKVLNICDLVCLLPSLALAILMIILIVQGYSTEQMGEYLYNFTSLSQSW